MKLSSLRLNNIRSYKDHEIIFDEGITLFEGDIGSGKSSILHAVEFALFGLGNLSGRHLLRVGEREGKVELRLEVSGVPYIFGRSLRRRRKSVTQDTCYVVEGDVKTTYNATDMKRKALQILGFREPTSPRSHSVIYRYAIFTPQEQMREVIRQRPENRKETLRKAFGIDEYSTATSNTGVISSWLRERIGVLERSKELRDETLEKIEDEKARKKEASDSHRSAMGQLEELRREITKINRQIKEKEAKEEELNRLNTDINVLNERKTRLEKDIQRTGEEIKELGEKIAVSVEAEKRLKVLEPDHIRFIEEKSRTVELEPIYAKYAKADNTKSRLLSEIKIQRDGYLERLKEHMQNLDRKEGELEKITEELRELDALSEEAESIEKEVSTLPDAQERLNRQNRKIERLSEQKRQRLELQTSKQSEWDEIEAVGVGANCPLCQQELSETHYTDLKEKYEEELREIEASIQDFKENLDREEVIGTELSALVGKLGEKSRELNQLKVKIERLYAQQKIFKQTKTEAQRISGEKMKIEQLLVNDAFAEEKLQKINALDGELEASKPEAEQYVKAREELQRLEEANIEVRYTEAKSVAERKAEYEAQKRDNKTELDQVNATMNDLKEELRSKEDLYERNKTVLKELEDLRGLHTEKTKLEGELNGTITQHEKEIQKIDKDLIDLQKNLERYGAEIQEAEALRLIRIWLNEFFMPTLEAIEKNVLLHINQEFNTLFRRWFETLVESGELSAYIDEDFTPFIEQDGYELEVESLSGGEKTSVALAYRLALNTVVKQVTDTMKSNLLILDEPTDGFSRDQLYKMRDILTDLNCNQVIIVSHEKELESVADQIYRVSKENTVSTVTRSLQ